jgi:ATP-dependent protease HslVU (ClpYQ) peptidase subunit
MSVIVAVKENDVVYMGADSQTSIGGNKIHVLNESGFKIVRQDNGVPVGMCGDVGGHNAVTTEKNFVSLDENGMLTKKHIVNEIIPKLLSPSLKLYDEKKQDLSISLILAFKDKLYKIMSNLTVIKCNTHTSSGSGKSYTRYDLYAHSELPVKERIVKALRSSANRDASVGAPFVLIDTKNLEYEIVD